MVLKLKPSKTSLEIEKNVVRKSFFVSLITFIIVLIIVFFGWRYSMEGLKFRQQIKFDALSKEMSSLVTARIQSCIEVLYGAQRFFTASNKVERDEWRTFINPESLHERYPAITAVRYVERVSIPDLPNFINEIKNDTSVHPQGYPNFQIKSLSDETGVNNLKSEAFIVKFLEPFEGNEQMLGLDVSSDELRRRAYEQAWVTGEAAMAKVTEVVSGQSAFTICFPVYQNAAPLYSVQDRKKATIGFVDIVFRAQDFFKTVFGKNKIFNQIDYEVFTGEVEHPDSAKKRLIFQSWSDPSKTDFYRASIFHNSYHIIVPGSEWTIFFYASKDFASQEIGKEIPELVLLGGTVLGFLIWAVLYVLSTSRFQAVVLAQKITGDLRESEQKFRAITQSAMDAIISINNEGNIIFWNQGAERVFGYKEQEILDKNVTVLIPIRYQGDHKKGIARFLETGQAKLIGKTVEVEGIRKDGTEFPVEISLANWQRESEHFFTAILRDISGRKKAQKREFLEHHIIKLLSTTNTLKIVASNIVESICMQFGWDGGAVWLIDDQKTTIRCFETWFRKDAPQTLEAYTNYFEKGKGLPGQVWEQNEYMWVRNSSSNPNPYPTIMFPIGSILEVVGVLELTGTKILEPEDELIKMFRAIASQIYQFIQRNVAERELVKAQSALAEREKSDVIAQLAAGVAHEVKNPLSILLQGADYFKNNQKFRNKEDSEIVDLMINAIERADRIIKGLLELSHPETINPRPEDIHSIIDTSLLLVKNQLDRRSIVVQKQYDFSVPKVNMDRGRIEQVFINLFSNSIEAMEGTGELVIRTKLSQLKKDSESSNGKKSLVVEVEDTGPGIPEVLLSKIFNPFVTSKRAKGGSGLGLPIVRNIMEVHKGWAHVENIKGRGAKVSLIFPI